MKKGDTVLHRTLNEETDEFIWKERLLNKTYLEKLQESPKDFVPTDGLLVFYLAPLVWRQSITAKTCQEVETIFGRYELWTPLASTGDFDTKFMARYDWNESRDSGRFFGTEEECKTWAQNHYYSRIAPALVRTTKTKV